MKKLTSFVAAMGFAVALNLSAQTPEDWVQVLQKGAIELSVQQGYTVCPDELEQMISVEQVCIEDLGYIGDVHRFRLTSQGGNPIIIDIIDSGI